MEQVQRAIRLASRRHFLVEGASQVGLAVSISMAGLILLLLLGTNIFDWYWPVLLLFVGLAVGIYRLQQRALSRYRIAQLLDQKLALSDSLSTAQYFSEHPLPGHDEALRFQLQQAEQMARTADIQTAFPFQARRVWAVAGGLAAVSFGLLALRYMVTNSLSLHPPLVSFQIASVVERVEKALGKKKDRDPNLLAHDREITTRADSAGSEQPDRANLPPQGPGNEDEGAKSASGDPSAAMNQGQKMKDDAGKDATGRDSLSPKGQPGDKTPGDNNESAKQQAGDQTKEQAGKEGGKSSEGLINRMKDALSSLAAKMQPNQNQQGQQGQAKDDKSTQEKAAGQQQASNGNNKDQQGNQQQDGKGQQSDQNQTAEGQGQGQTAEKAQSAQGQSSDQSPQKGADAHSGVGKQDGDKGIKDAEQLKAMGKLADLIGKRSAQLTGEMTVETSSGKQQLRTQYSQKMGEHSDSGGEINRNEVPPIFQRYVREYMDEVRKTEKTNQ
jgi:hypothetical protein